ncbi:MAG: Gfo/Idh/MocA family oxidoreductase [Lactobacillus sp.]|nr:Gfo/Idh/MocA family oxidoreductase [Lactobacillus sp.]
MKLLIAGAGFIVSDFLPITKDLKNLEIVGISGMSADLDKMKEYQAKYDISNIYTNYVAALKETNADTVYVAVPNFLHFLFAKKALEASKNVICEKPFTVKYEEFQELRRIAENKKLILVEAITNQYLTNYNDLKDELKNIGKVKIISMNYSQYSHRYDAFKQGNILPVFDPKKGGGALMDLNIYNIHFLIGLFGMPKAVTYKANIERGVDTSGVLNLDYEDFKAVSIAAKDVSAPVTSLIEAEDKTLVVNGPANVMDSFDIIDHNNNVTHVDDKIYDHRMYEEFSNFINMIDNQNLKEDKKALDHSDKVMQVLQKAIKSANLKLD